MVDDDWPQSEWDNERHAVMRCNAIGGFNGYEIAYGNTVLLACQHALDHEPAVAAAELAVLDHWDKDLLNDIGKAIMLAPLPNGRRRASLYGALKMASGLIWSDHSD